MLQSTCRILTNALRGNKQNKAPVEGGDPATMLRPGIFKALTASRRTSATCGRV
ncbi:hypothetical protein COMA1_10511 [Candidatus Nitrospira nitrosa]|uniref:Uncharacterized protein n=1 Tax=Candidatus Nitrospira nitrosa TaxID=1742972 RepID=A0A0S4L6D7_9BACT|nr:hypothetical protein COMA1_10511 [Candidatus Nitrospira nitrosa]